jgi:hypothetical protein
MRVLDSRPTIGESPHPLSVHERIDLIGGPDTPRVDAVIDENAEKERTLAIFDGLSYSAIVRENAAL